MLGNVCIIGVGLIGGSFARALRRARYCAEIVGSGRDAEHLQKAVDLGVIDRFDTDIAVAVSTADFIVVAVPLGAMDKVFRAIAPHLKPGAVVTDVGSAKASVVLAARAAFTNTLSRFVPGHPIAGTEQSGVAASYAELYEGRRVIITPLEETDRSAIAQVEAAWRVCGAHVVEMSVEHHDDVLAATSHLPHLLAYGLVDSLSRRGEREEIFQYAAGGFRDFTRIASSDPAMWRDICLANREAVLGSLARFSGDLEEIALAIAASDGEKLYEIFSRAKQARDRYVK